MGEFREDFHIIVESEKEGNLSKSHLKAQFIKSLPKVLFFESKHGNSQLDFFLPYGFKWWIHGTLRILIDRVSSKSFKNSKYSQVFLNGKRH